MGQKEMKCKFCEDFNFLKTIQKPKVVEGDKIRYKYTCAFVDEIVVNGQERGRTTHYTWLKLRYCPCCGKKL